MRSSKSRSRSKNNRNRNPLGNVVNRVFDSSGPEGKVRGTPQQIIDKYNQLARDASLGNDRVAAENFQQHAEHYMRMLSEAQKEADQRREQQERENRDRQAQRDRDRGDRSDRDPQQQGRSDQDDSAENAAPAAAPQPPREPEQPQRATPGFGDQPDVLDLGADDSESGLVETPEDRAEVKPEPAAERPAPRSRSRGGAKPAPKPKKPPQQGDLF